MQIHNTKLVGTAETGRKILLIEGIFSSGNGMSEDAVYDAMPASLTIVETINLAEMLDLWGGPITDQRILFMAG